jgi:ATP-dependent DNA ligase
LYLERGKRLADALPEASRVIGQAISVGERGSDFYEQVKAHDPAGIVAKRAAAPYARGVK